jgi:hypothetical protein
MPRYFSHEQATRLLPEVERLLRLAIHARAVYEEADQEISSLQQRAQSMGGIVVDISKARLLQESRVEGARHLREAIESITELGVQVKDLDTGLVDFPTTYHGEEVLLCWRLGEHRIAHWHGLEEGVRGRKPIDSEFLQNHGGGGVH